MSQCHVTLWHYLDTASKIIWSIFWVLLGYIYELTSMFCNWQVLKASYFKHKIFILGSQKNIIIFVFENKQRINDISFYIQYLMKINIWFTIIWQKHVYVNVIWKDVASVVEWWVCSASVREVVGSNPAGDIFKWYRIFASQGHLLPYSLGYLAKDSERLLSEWQRVSVPREYGPLSKGQNGTEQVCRGNNWKRFES